MANICAKLFNPMVHIKLLTFASLRDRLSEEPVVSLSIETDVWRSSDDLKKFLLQKLHARWATRQRATGELNRTLELPPAKTFMLAINETQVSENNTEQIVLQDCDQVALIPPVSGG